MNTDIYISKFHEEAFTGILNCLKKVNPADLSINHIVLVPDRYTLSLEKLIYGSLQGKGSFNITVLTLNRLASRLALKQKYLSVNGAVMTVRKAVKDVFNSLKYYQKSSQFAGFSKSVYKEICKLKSLLISPKDLKEIIEKESAEIGTKLKDLYLIYERYQDLIKDKYIDTEGYLKIIEQTSKNSNFILNSNFYIAGFDYFTLAELNAIQSIAKYCNKISFALIENQSITKVKQILTTLNYNINIQNIQDKRNTAINYIYQNANNFKIKPFKENYENICLYALPNSLQETENVAQQIIIDVKENGLRYKDICVVMPKITEYLYPLDKTFKKYNIPYYTSESTLLREEPLFISLYNLIISVVDNCNVVNVLTFIKSGYFTAEKNEKEIFENYCYKYGIDRSRFINSFNLNDNTDNIETAEKVRKSFNEYYNLIKNCKKDCKSITNILREILNKLHHNYDNNILEDNFIDEYAYRKQAYEKINKLLNEIEEININEQISLKDYSDLLIAGAENVRLSIVPSSADTVNCGGFDMPRYLSAKSIYILSVTEGDFPSVNFPTFLINYNDIKGFDKTEYTDSKIQLNRERERIKLLLCNSAKISLSYSVYAGDGKETKSAEYFNKLQNMFNIKINQELKYKFKTEKSNFYNYSDNITSAKELFFASDTTSVSAMETYFACPRKFLYHYGFFAMPRKEIRLKSLDKGVFLHAVMELFVNEFIKNQIEDIVALAINCFDNVLSQKEYQRYLNDTVLVKDFEKLKEEVIRTCRAISYQIKNSDFKPEYIEAEFDKYGKFSPIEIDTTTKNIFLKGKIDRADIFDYQDKKYIRVIDYKSGGIKSEDKNLYFGTKIQLFMYMHALKLAGFMPAGAYYYPVNNKFIGDGEISYQLIGVSLNEKEILFAQDNNIKTTGISNFIDVKLNPEDNGYKSNTKLIEKEKFDKFIEYAVKISKKAAEEIFQGNVCISPQKDICKYCEYLEVCSQYCQNAVIRNLKVKNAAEKILEAANDRV